MDTVEILAVDLAVDALKIAEAFGPEADAVDAGKIAEVSGPEADAVDAGKIAEVSGPEADAVDARKIAEVSAPGADAVEHGEALGSEAVIRSARSTEAFRQVETDSHAEAACQAETACQPAAKRTRGPSNLSSLPSRPVKSGTSHRFGEAVRDPQRGHNWRERCPGAVWCGCW